MDNIQYTDTAFDVVLPASTGSTNNFNEYYSAWANGLPSDASFYPIGVWVQQSILADNYQLIGINLYVGGPTERSHLVDLIKYSMPVICFQDDFNLAELTESEKNIIAGWMQNDEQDNAQWNESTQSYDPCIAPQVLIDNYNKWKSKDATRPVYCNFGAGVANTDWVGRGTCTGHTEMYSDYSKGADIVSFDIYPVTTNVSDVKGDLTFVGQGVENLISFTGKKKAVWAIIETTHITSNIKPSPAQVRSEVWMAIIHGANGIIYFCQDWNYQGRGVFNDHAMLDDTVISDAVSDINSDIKSLAPVINSLDGTNGSNAAGNLDYMLRYYGDYIYLFTINMTGGGLNASFNLSGSSIGDCEIEVYGEDRSIAMNGGHFDDSYGPYEAHIYRINKN